MPAGLSILPDVASPPVVSVVLPVRNGELYVKDAVESILTQTFPDFELLVLDDGSSDNTPHILSDLAERDSRMHIISSKTRGLVATLNDAFARSRGKYVARMDADD